MSATNEALAANKRGHHVMVATNGPGRAVSETTGPPGTTPGGERSQARFSVGAPCA